MSRLSLSSALYALIALAFAPSVLADVYVDEDVCSVTLSHDGGVLVDLYGPAPDKGRVSYDVVNSTLTFDISTQVLADGDYVAIWNDGFTDEFSLACTIDPDVSPPESQSLDPIQSSIVTLADPVITDLSQVWPQLMQPAHPAARRPAPMSYPRLVS